MTASDTGQTRKKFPLSGKEIAVLLVLVAMSLAATVVYVTHENVLYWSDYWQHFYVWQQSVELIQLSPGYWLQWLLNANAEVSPYYTVLNLPIGLIFGRSRLSFELSVMLCYAWPFLLLSSLVVAKLFAVEQRRKVFWIALSVIGLNPLFWAIPLRGYPDYAAGCMLMLGWLIYLGDPLMKRRSNPIWIGALFGLTPLLRRHYAYPVLAAFLSMFMQQLALVKTGTWSAFVRTRACWSVLVNFLVIGLYAAALAALLGFHYLNDVINFNYDQVFKAFHLSAAYCARWYAISYGAVPLLLTAAGWYLTVRDKLLSPGNGMLIAAYAVIVTVLWFSAVEMIGLHYTAHFAWIMSIGLTGLVFRAMDFLMLAKPLLAAIYGFFILNLLQGLGVPLPGLPRATVFEVYAQESKGDPLSYLFSAANPPVVRTDLDEIQRLCDFLRAHFGSKARLSVAASSSVFNDELLHSAFGRFVPEGDRKNLPQLIKLPQIDFRDDSPIHNLAQCDCLIVAEPAQYHLLPDRQILLLYTIESFRKNIGLAKDFEAMEPKFHLEKGVTLTVYRRAQSPTLPQLFDSIQAFRPFDRAPHHMRNPWLVWQGLGQVDSLFITRLRKHVPVMRVPAAGKAVNLQLIYLGALDEPLVAHAKLTGAAQGSARGEMSTIDAGNGEKTKLTQFTLDAAQDQMSAPVPARATALLSIDMTIAGQKNKPGQEWLIELPAPLPSD